MAMSSSYIETMSYVLRDVVEPFTPTITMKVQHGTEKLINGSQLKQKDVETTPTVYIGGDSKERYTLAIIDPDAPNPNDPKLQQVVSWIVTNIPGGKSTEEGIEVVKYLGPSPKIGIHRIILLLYQQESSIGSIEALESRECFKIQDFAEKYKLGKPVGVAHYTVQRQSLTNKRKSSSSK